MRYLQDQSWDGTATLSTYPPPFSRPQPSALLPLLPSHGLLQGPSVHGDRPAHGTDGELVELEARLILPAKKYCFVKCFK